MKIQNSNIAMFEQHALLIKQEKKESLKVWIGNQRPNFEGKKFVVDPTFMRDAVTLSDKVKKGGVSQTEEDEEAGLSAADKMRLLVTEMVLEQLTGEKVHLKISMLRMDQKAVDTLKQNTPNPIVQREGWGVEYDLHESYSESEKMSFDADGVVNTSDGMKIKFSVNLKLSREFTVRHDISIRAGDAKKVDPLVVNFSGTAAQLTETKHQFDLNSDGRKDNMSFVQPGSGFLAVDKNDDGKINNGKELFGPNTGNGFDELAKYDSDGNQWIDESDPIFKKLKIWTKDAKGTDSFFTLADKNVGAIFLGSISVQFEYKNAQNDSHGEAKRNGVFLKENGMAGTVQQVDLTV
jgi:hypothetical protein